MLAFRFSITYSAVCSSVPVFLGLFFAPFYIQLNAVTHGSGRTTSILCCERHIFLNFGLKLILLAFLQVPILNAGSICGRIIPGAFVHTFGTINLATFFTISSGIVVISMIAVKTFAATAVFGVLFGIFSGASIALTPCINWYVCLF